MSQQPKPSAPVASASADQIGTAFAGQHGVAPADPVPLTHLASALAARQAGYAPRAGGAGRILSRVRRIGFWCLLGLVGIGALMTVLVGSYRFVDPPVSSLMLIRSAQGYEREQRWVPLSQISPHLIRAVISSEDGRFCTHYGIDIEEIQAAIRRARGGLPRGASTMTMQLAKNLFLWTDKSYFRKAIEAPLTLMIEAFWPKWRIAEVYLNVVEWGPGIYGAEAAARHHFGKSAASLTPREAALLAVSLPAPLKRNPGRPKALTRKLANNIVRRVRLMGDTYHECVLQPRAGLIAGEKQRKASDQSVTAAAQDAPGE